jgi:hypothetical protein
MSSNGPSCRCCWRFSGGHSDTFLRSLLARRRPHTRLGCRPTRARPALLLANRWLGHVQAGRPAGQILAGCMLRRATQACLRVRPRQRRRTFTTTTKTKTEADQGSRTRLPLRAADRAEICSREITTGRLSGASVCRPCEAELDDDDDEAEEASFLFRPQSVQVRPDHQPPPAQLDAAGDRSIMAVAADRRRRRTALVAAVVAGHRQRLAALLRQRAVICARRYLMRRRNRTPWQPVPRRSVTHVAEIRFLWLIVGGRPETDDSAGRRSLTRMRRRPTRTHKRAPRELAPERAGWTDREQRPMTEQTREFKFTLCRARLIGGESDEFVGQIS